MSSTHGISSSYTVVQPFDEIGIFLPYPVFSHGQLYVAFLVGKVMFWKYKLSIKQTRENWKKMEKYENVVYLKIIKWDLISFDT